jgi:hypothetical protein
MKVKTSEPTELSMCEILEEAIKKDVWTIVCQSEEFDLTESNIQSNFENIDWTALCSNSSVRWTVKLIGKYKKNLDWSALSYVIADNNNFDEKDFDTLLSRYFEKLNWEAICQGTNIRNDHIDTYAKFIDWNALSSNNHFNWTKEFVDNHLNDINWSVFTEYLFEKMGEDKPNSLQLYSFIYDEYRTYLDFEILSENCRICFTPRLLRVYRNKFNWQKLINNPAVIWSENKWFDYRTEISRLPLNVIKESYMWSVLIQRKANIEIDNGKSLVINKLNETTMNTKTSEPRELTVYEILEVAIEKDRWTTICESEEFDWTELDIQFNFKNIDWTALCFNSSVPWTVDIIKKYEKNIDWAALSYIIADKNYFDGSDFDLLLSNYTKELDWKVICKGTNLAEKHVAEYSECINWRALCSNSRFMWTDDFISAHLNDMDWSVFTKCLSTGNMATTEEADFRNKVVELYADYLDFDLLSDNNCINFTSDFLEQHQDKLNWAKLINNPAVEWNRNLYDQYEKQISQIPIKDIRESYMWKKRCVESDLEIRMLLSKL